MECTGRDLILLGAKVPESLVAQRIEVPEAVGKDEVGSSNLPSSSRKQLISSEIGCFSLLFTTF